MSVRVEHGDCREVVKALADGSIDAVVTDPPYSLVSIQKRFGRPGSAPAQEGRDGLYRRASAGFMGQQWDTGETAFDPDWWRKVLRVMKPGAHLVAFSGTRTYHRMACAIEDAGFEIRDQLAWCYGAGFPKSHNVGKAIDKAAGVQRVIIGRAKGAASTETESLGEFAPEYDVTLPATDAAREWAGWGTALKPAWEPIVLARKPLSGTVAANVLGHGTGAINIDGCRIGTDEDLNGGAYSGSLRQRGEYTSTDSVAGAVPLSRLNRGAGEYNAPAGRWPANLIHDGSDEVVACFPEQSGGGTPERRISPKTAAVYGKFAHGMQVMPGGIGGSSGNAARFFFSAKADADDRCDSKHPTVKPVALMRWLTRLVTPRGGTVLDPFAGSGTTGVACIRESFNAILIEREDQYVADIKHRLDKLQGLDAPLFARGAE